MIGGIIAADFAEARAARLLRSADGFPAVSARAAKHLHKGLADRPAHGRARRTNASADHTTGHAQGGNFPDLGDTLSATSAKQGRTPAAANAAKSSAPDGARPAFEGTRKK